MYLHRAWYRESMRYRGEAPGRMGGVEMLSRVHEHCDEIIVREWAVQTRWTGRW
jgi:hypothetical protein